MQTSLTGAANTAGHLGRFLPRYSRATACRLRVISASSHRGFTSAARCTPCASRPAEHCRQLRRIDGPREFGTTHSLLKGKQKAEEVDEEIPFADDVVVKAAGSMVSCRAKLLDTESTLSVRSGRIVGSLEPLADAWQAFEARRKEYLDSLKLSETEVDEEMRSLAQDECASLIETLEELKDELRRILLENHATFARLARESILSSKGESSVAASSSSASSSQAKAVIMEIRPGVGGQESQLFTAQIMRMYRKFAENVGWQVEELSLSAADISTGTPRTEAYKEAIIEITGQGVYQMLKWEAGVHRVQRIPITQNLGKLQTSTIAVVVLPVDDSAGSEAKDDLVDPKDVKTEVMRSRGAGGQHVNKTESAIRLTHLPTGITVSMQDSRSQHQNRTKAWSILRARLLDIRLKDEEKANRAVRKDQVASMERSDRVRTYNFPQDRVTDHRLGLSLNEIDSVMEGEFDGEWTAGLGRLMEELRVKDEENHVEELDALWRIVADIQ